MLLLLPPLSFPFHLAHVYFVRQTLSPNVLSLFTSFSVLYQVQQLLGHLLESKLQYYVPEKFYDSKTGVINFEALSKSYSELEKKSSAAPAPKADEPPAPKAAETPKPVEIAAVPGVPNESVCESHKTSF